MTNQELLEQILKNQENLKQLIILLGKKVDSLEKKNVWKEKFTNPYELKYANDYSGDFSRKLLKQAELLT